MRSDDLRETKNEVPTDAKAWYNRSSFSRARRSLWRQRLASRKGNLPYPRSLRYNLSSLTESRQSYSRTHKKRQFQPYISFHHAAAYTRALTLSYDSPQHGRTYPRPTYSSLLCVLAASCAANDTATVAPSGPHLSCRGEDGPGDPDSLLRYTSHTAGGGSLLPAARISSSLFRISSLEGLNRLNFGRAKAVSGWGAFASKGSAASFRAGGGARTRQSSTGGKEDARLERAFSLCIRPEQRRHSSSG